MNIYIRHFSTAARERGYWPRDFGARLDSCVRERIYYGIQKNTNVKRVLKFKTAVVALASDSLRNTTETELFREVHNRELVFWD
jgi:hypothetical protein